MPRYHINDEGNVGPCNAATRCPFGDLNSDHYGSAELARSAYEAKNTSFDPPLTPDSFARKLETKYPNAQLTLRFSHGGYAVLDGIRLPKGEQGQGVGTAIMEDLVRKADEQGWKMALTPSTDWGASSKARLERFYRRFGFVPNRGRNKDFTTMESMLRLPSKI